MIDRIYAPSDENEEAFLGKAWLNIHRELWNVVCQCTYKVCEALLVSIESRESESYPIIYHISLQ